MKTDPQSRTSQSDRTQAPTSGQRQGQRPGRNALRSLSHGELRSVAGGLSPQPLPPRT